MLYVLCLDIYWLGSLLISSCTTLLLQSQWPCSSSSMLDLTQHRALTMLFPPSVMFCLEIWTDWIFFFSSKTFLSERQPSYLIKIYYYSSPSVRSTIQSWSPSPHTIFPHGTYYSSHMLSFLLIYYVYCLLSSQKHKLHKCRNLSLFINQCKHLKLLRIVSVFST